MNDFDATVRDAILTTRALNIKHIWIDALCIFQEKCATDWLTQSSKMRYIYEKYTVTLVPVNSASVKQGFLDPRNTKYAPLSWRGVDKVHQKNQHGSFQQVFLSESWNLENDKLNGPWMKRGWTLQEGLLPNRLLFYSSSQMAWKCCEQILYERGAGSEPLVDVVRGFRDEGGKDFWSFDLFTKFKLLHWFIRGPGLHVEHEKYRLWYDLVEDYSLRQIEHTSDRLIAISGVAEKYADIIEDDQYVAGLWRADMIRGLLWHVPKVKLFDATASDQLLCGGYNGPSWSWLSMAPGFVVQNEWASLVDFRSFAIIEDVRVDLVDPSNLFGKVKGGTVTLSGPTLQFSKLYNEDWQSPGAMLSAFERHLSHIIECDHSQGAKSFSQEGRFAALLMLQHWPSYDNQVDILILQATEPNAKTTSSSFKRIGLVTLAYISDRFNSPSRLHMLYEKARNSLRYRLNPGSWPRKVKRTYCKEVFQEIENNPWPRQSITIV